MDNLLTVGQTHDVCVMLGYAVLVNSVGLGGNYDNQQLSQGFHLVL